MKRPGRKYFLYDDGPLDYSPLIEPRSQATMLGYKAVAWNTDLSMTGLWQGKNVLAMTTASPLFDIAQEISQGIQVQNTWNAYEQLPWLWTERGQAYELTIELDYAVPVSWGNNLRQAVAGYRFEDVSAPQEGTGHGQRLWVQFGLFDSLYPNRGIEIWSDPHTNHEDVALQVPVAPDGRYAEYFDFSGSTTGIRSGAFSDMQHIEVSMSRQQFTNLIALVEDRLGVDLQNESGYWSMIHAMGASVEMASFATPQWGIADHGAMQMAVANLEVFGF